jgi:2-oxo-4-hydroxy-4-carboxy-5-ureidoimidazoline decarboxylase
MSSSVNDFSEEEFRYNFLLVCNSAPWVDRMAARRPFSSLENLLDAAAAAWAELTEEQLIAAFATRPLLGDIEALSRDLWSAQEDALNLVADAAAVKRVYDTDVPYQAKFGFECILLCEGMTPEQQFQIVTERMKNDRTTEFAINAAEDLKVTQRRLAELWAGRNPYQAHAAH